MSTINLETVSPSVYTTIHEMDRANIGTDDYIGLAWYHNYHYRHTMRDISIAKRKRIHTKLMERGLALDGKSRTHSVLIASVTPLQG